MPLNPNLFMYDDGRLEDTSGQSGLGLQMMGQEQNRLRRAQIMEQNRARQTQPYMGGPLKGLMDGLGLGPNPMWDGYFGAMQGKENAIAAQGGKTNIDMRGSWGPQRHGVRFNAGTAPVQALANLGIRR